MAISMPSFSIFGSRSSKESSRERRKGKHSSEYSTDGYIPQPLVHDPLMRGNFWGRRGSVGPEDGYHQKHSDPRGHGKGRQDLDKEFQAARGTYSEVPYGTSGVHSDVHNPGGAVAAILPAPSRTQTPVPAVHRESVGIDSGSQPGVAPYGDDALPKDDRIWPSDAQHKNQGHGFLPAHLPSIASSARRRSRSRSHGYDDASEEENLDSSSEDRSTEPPSLLFSSRASDHGECRSHTPRHRDAITHIYHERERHHSRRWPEEGHDPMFYHYIIPAGLNVILRDDNGNELARIGNFNRPSHHPPTVVIQDDEGQELYRVGDFDAGSSFDSLSRDQDSWGQSGQSGWEQEYRHERGSRRSSRERPDKHRRSRHSDDDRDRRRRRSRSRKYEEDYAHQPAYIEPMHPDYLQSYPYGYPQPNGYPISNGNVVVVDEYGWQTSMPSSGGAHPRSGSYGHRSRSYR